MLLRVLLDSLLPPISAEAKPGDSNDHERRQREELERRWCFELASSVLALLVDHVRSPHSAELWLELHYGLGAATARHRAALAAPANSGGNGAGDDGGTGSVGQEGAECAAVRRTSDLLSQAVGHMGGILLREESIGATQAALLAEALAELTSPDLFWRPETSSECRRAVVELLAVSLCGLHKHQRLVRAMPRVIRAAAAPSALDAESGSSKTVGVVAAMCAVDIHPAVALSRSLLGGVGAERTANKPPPMRVTRAVALSPLLEACAGPLSGQADAALEVLVRVIHGTGVGLVFVGDKVNEGGGRGGRGAREAAYGSDDECQIAGDGGEGLGALVIVAGAEGPGGLPVGIAEGQKVCVFLSCLYKTSGEQGAENRKCGLMRRLSHLERGVDIRRFRFTHVVGVRS